MNRRSRALGFNGSNAQVDLGNWFDLQSFTLALWVKPAGTQQAFATIIDDNYSSAAHWQLAQDNTAQNRYAWRAADSSAAITFSLTANTWQHVVITRDDDTHAQVVYVNGVAVGNAVGYRIPKIRLPGASSDFGDHPDHYQNFPIPFDRTFSLDGMIAALRCSLPTNSGSMYGSSQVRVSIT